MAGGFLSGLLRLGRSRDGSRGEGGEDSGVSAAEHAGTVAVRAPVEAPGKKSSRPVSVRVDNVSACRRTVSVSVSSELFREEFDGVVGLYASMASIPGFRKGKAPPEMVERRYSKEIIEETRDRLIPKYYSEALRMESLTPVGVVDLSEVAATKDSGLNFRVTVDVAPEFKLPKYVKIPIKREGVAISAEQVDSAVNDMRMRESTYLDVSGRGARAGDIVQADFTGEMDGRPLSEAHMDCEGLSSGKDMWIRLSDPDFIPGFTKGLEGSALGEEREIIAEFSADYHIEAVKGRKVTYKVVVKAVREPVPAAIETLTKRFGVETEEALREKVREMMTEQGLGMRKNMEKQQILTYLVEKTGMSLPESVVGHAVSSSARRLVARMVMDGAKKEDVENNRDDILKAASAMATRTVKVAYILAKIAEIENIKVTKEEMESRCEEESRRRGVSMEKFRSELEESEELDAFKENVLNDKTLEYLWSQLECGQVAQA